MNKSLTIVAPLVAMSALVVLGSCAPIGTKATPAELQPVGDEGTTLPDPGAISAIDQKRAEQASNSRIVNGDLAKEDEWPWIAAIGQPDGSGVKPYCAGTLIAADWLLTAAHCEILVGDYAVLGRPNLAKTNEGRQVKVAEVIPHPKYDDNTLDFDLALVRLESAQANTLIAIVDASERALVQPDKLRIAGWGRLGETRYELSNRLQTANVSIQDQQRCVDSYHEIGRTVTENMLCGQGHDTRGKITDACQGDSGGPLVALSNNKKATLVGIISKGSGCARKGYPGVYTRISKLTQWISSCQSKPTPDFCRSR